MFVWLGKDFAVRRLQYSLASLLGLTSLTSLTGLNRKMILLLRLQSRLVVKLTRQRTRIQPAPLARQDRRYADRNFLSRPSHTAEGHHRLIKLDNDLLTGCNI
jgi:hypothetical protein